MVCAKFFHADDDKLDIIVVENTTVPVSKKYRKHNNLLYEGRGVPEQFY